MSGATETGVHTDAATIGSVEKLTQTLKLRLELPARGGGGGESGMWIKEGLEND